MANWNYSEDPASSNRDAVRWLVGDTDTSDQLLLDREIDYAYAQEGSVKKAAALCARALAGKYARLCDKAVDDLRISYSQRQKQFWELSEKLDKEAATAAGVSPYTGGISISDKDSVADDSDRVAPAFKVDQMRYYIPIAETDED